MLSSFSREMFRLFIFFVKKLVNINALNDLSSFRVPTLLITLEEVPPSFYAKYQGHLTTKCPNPPTEETTVL
jgi:hypothetical protein